MVHSLRTRWSLSSSCVRGPCPLCLWTTLRFEPMPRVVPIPVPFFQNLSISSTLRQRKGDNIGEISLTVCSGLDMVNINLNHFVFADKETAEVPTASCSKGWKVCPRVRGEIVRTSACYASRPKFDPSDSQMFFISSRVLGRWKKIWNQPDSCLRLNEQLVFGVFKTSQSLRLVKINWKHFKPNSVSNQRYPRLG